MTPDPHPEDGDDPDQDSVTVYITIPDVDPYADPDSPDQYDPIDDACSAAISGLAFALEKDRRFTGSTMTASVNSPPKEWPLPAVEVTGFDVGGDVRSQATVTEYDTITEDGKAVVAQQGGKETFRMEDSRITAVEAPADQDATSENIEVPEQCPRCDADLAYQDPYVDPDDPLTVKAALECTECFWVADTVQTPNSITVRSGNGGVT